MWARVVRSTATPVIYLHFTIDYAVMLSRLRGVYAVVLNIL